jgi:hypothetical protein
MALPQPEQNAFAQRAGFGQPPMAQGTAMQGRFLPPAAQMGVQQQQPQMPMAQGTAMRPQMPMQPGMAQQPGMPQPQPMQGNPQDFLRQRMMGMGAMRL